MTSWVRLWHDMPTDPKWRVIANRSGRPLSEVLSVFVFMLTNASVNAARTQTNANERGELANWCDEDVAAALDMKSGDVAAIREAMQGKTLTGIKLTGWEKRQPLREDNSAERAKAWRERKRTQTNARKRPDTDTDTEEEVEVRVQEKEENNLYTSLGDAAREEAQCRVQGKGRVQTKILDLKEGRRAARSSP